jgi:dihydrodipicolinate synthase/N-acetylneuraminate lyase
VKLIPNSGYSLEEAIIGRRWFALCRGHHWSLVRWIQVRGFKTASQVPFNYSPKKFVGLLKKSQDRNYQISLKYEE